MKKRKIRLKHKLVEALDLPSEAAEGQLRVVLLGRGDMSVENHEGIFEYEADSIRLTFPGGMLRVTGEGLELKELSQAKAYISGRIHGMALE